MDESGYQIIPKNELYEKTDFIEYDTESLTEDDFEHPFISREEHLQIVKTYQNTIYNLIENYETQLKLKDEANKVLLDQLKTLRGTVEVTQSAHSSQSTQSMQSSRLVEEVDLTDFLDPSDDEAEGNSGEYSHPADEHEITYQLESSDNENFEENEDYIIEEEPIAVTISDVDETPPIRLAKQGALLSINIEPSGANATNTCGICNKTMSSYKVLRVR